MAVERRLNIVTLGVADLDASRRFYVDGLGWRASSASQEKIVFIQLGGIVLALHPREMLAEDATVAAEGSGFRGITLAHNVRDKAEVGPVLQQAEQAGGRIVKPAHDVYWGGHSGYFADPDGFLWEVAWNPYAQMNDKGELVLPA